MNACGFGAFVPFGEVRPGTLFLDHSLDGSGNTAILLKVRHSDGRHNVVRIFDPAVAGRGGQTPALGAMLTDDRLVVALAEYLIEVEHSVETIAWDSDASFVKAVLCAGSDGRLYLKAFRNRNRDDCECDLFELAGGTQADLGRPLVGFHRWSVVRSNSYGNREVLFRFDG